MSKAKTDKKSQKQKLSDADYLKSDELGLVIAKGMAVMYKTEPKNPVDFLAKWLLNHAHCERAAEQEKKALQVVAQHKKAEEARLAEEARVAQEKHDAEKKRVGKIISFNSSVKKSCDLNDNLQALADHLKEFTSATATYIGQLVAPKKQIGDNADDTAHIDNESEKIIHFKHASEGFDYIVDKTLSSDQGLTFDVFKEEPVAEDAPVEDAAAEDGADAKPKIQEEKLPRHVVVPEVVREPRIHFFKVPRLGSYMSIRCEYDSCLSVEAFDAGVADYLQVLDKRREQNEMKLEWEAKQQELKEQFEADGENFVPETKEWNSIECAPYKTHKVTFVCCLNTLGQDRQFTAEEKSYALRCVQKYRDEWEQTEINNLRADIERKVATSETDKVYKEKHEQEDNVDMEAKMEQLIVPAEGEEPHTEETKIVALKKARFTLMTKGWYAPADAVTHKKMVDRERMRASASLDRSANPDQSATVEDKYYPNAPECWRNMLCDFKQYYIIKYPRVLQTLFYLLGYKRTDICERDTNRLEFKRVKQIIDDELFKKMSEYTPYGPKTDEFTEYQKMKWLKQNLESVDEEKLVEYSVLFEKLYRWISMAIDLRCEDIVSRRDSLELLKFERNEAIEADQAREARLAAAREEAITAHEEKVDEMLAKEAAAEGGEEPEEPAEGEDQAEKADQEEPERPPFDEQAFLEEFEAKDPKVEIPPEVIDDVDNDYNLPYTVPNFTKEE